MRRKDHAYGHLNIGVAASETLQLLTSRMEPNRIGPLGDNLTRECWLCKPDVFSSRGSMNDFGVAHLNEEHQ